MELALWTRQMRYEYASRSLKISERMSIRYKKYGKVRPPRDGTSPRIRFVHNPRSLARTAHPRAFLLTRASILFFQVRTAGTHDDHVGVPRADDTIGSPLCCALNCPGRDSRHTVPSMFSDRSTVCL